MPLKLRKISFEYHEAVLGTTSVALVLCPTGMCVLFNKRRYGSSICGGTLSFFRTFPDRNVERRRDHGVCSKKASSWRRSHKRRYALEVCPHFFDRFHIFVAAAIDRNIKRHRDHGVCSEKASSWRQSCRACRRAP
jgi:hypothetical protein